MSNSNVDPRKSSGMRRWWEGEELGPADFYKSVLDGVSTGVYVMDREEAVIYLNSAMAAIAGLPRQALIGVRLREFPQSTLREFLPRYEAVRQTLAPCQYDSVRVITPGGRESWQSGWLIPRIKNGVFDGLVCTVTDVTEQHKAEEVLRLHQENLEELVRSRTAELASAESRLRQIIDQIQDIVYLVSPEGRILSLNSTFETVCGWPTEQWIGESIEGIIHPDDLSKAWNLIRRCMEQRTQITEELRIRTPSGVYVLIEACCSPHIEQGGVGGVFGVGRDVTHRKENERALIRAERLVAVGTLVQGVAHQFNNLNAGILGYAELLLRASSLPDELRPRVEHIIDACNRASNITERLVDFARSGPSERVAADLNTVVRNATDLLAGDFESQGIELELQTRPFPPLPMDPVEIGQVVLNLLLNAKHALVGSSVKHIVVRTGRKDGCLFVSITDTGCGISPENLSRLFTPFFTTKGEFAPAGSPQNRVRGVGLGLSVSQTIAERHGGQIEVESKPGGGSTFTLRLPVTEGVPAASTVAAPAALEGVRVLVLDDDAPIRRIVLDLLQHSGYEAQGAQRGEDALALLREESFDVAIVDLQMPGMSGEAFLRQLDGLPPAQRPLPIILTGRVEEAAALAEEGIPVFDRIRKPFQPAYLLKQVRAAALTRRWGAAPAAE